MTSDNHDSLVQALPGSSQGAEHQHTLPVITVKRAPLPAIKEEGSALDENAVPHVAQAKSGEQTKRKIQGRTIRKSRDDSESELLVALRANGITWAHIVREYFPHWSHPSLMSKYNRLTATQPTLKARLEKMGPSEQLQVITRAWQQVRDVRKTQGASQQHQRQQEQAGGEQDGDVEEDLEESDVKKTKSGGVVWEIPESPDAVIAARPAPNPPPADGSNQHSEKQSEKDDPDAILYEHVRVKAKSRAKGKGALVPLPLRK